MYGNAGRIGLITLASDSSVLPEYTRVMPDGVAVYAAPIVLPRGEVATGAGRDAGERPWSGRRVARLGRRRRDRLRLHHRQPGPRRRVGSQLDRPHRARQRATRDDPRRRRSSPRCGPWARPRWRSPRRTWTSSTDRARVLRGKRVPRRGDRRARLRDRCRDRAARPGGCRLARGAGRHPGSRRDLHLLHELPLPAGDRVPGAPVGQTGRDEQLRPGPGPRCAGSASRTPFPAMAGCCNSAIPGGHRDMTTGDCQRKTRPRPRPIGRVMTSRT